MQPRLVVLVVIGLVVTVRSGSRSSDEILGHPVVTVNHPDGNYQLRGTHFKLNDDHLTAFLGECAQSVRSL